MCTQCKVAGPVKFGYSVVIFVQVLWNLGILSWFLSLCRSCGIRVLGSYLSVGPVEFGYCAGPVEFRYSVGSYVSLCRFCKI